MRSYVAMVMCAIIICQVSAHAQQQPSDRITVSPEGAELIEMIADIYAAYDELYAEIETINDPQKVRQIYESRDPATTFVPRLLEFEQQHPGEDVGLMALRQIIRMAAGGGYGDSAVDVGRRETLQRLPRYHDRTVTVEVIRYLTSGNFEPQLAPYLRELAQSAPADPTLREYGRFMLAEFLLDARNGRAANERRLADLAAGGESLWPGEENDRREALEHYPPEAQINQWETEAHAILQRLIDEASPIRQPAVKGLDPDWRLVQIDEMKTHAAPLISEKAAGLLFKDQHLRVGRAAPPLELRLLDGKAWSLAAERGHVVIIQFSFKGCGPCEAMYPELRKLSDDYVDRVTILTIMADEQREDAVDAQSSGKITWDVSWDGHRGPLATRWAVEGFPAVYVIDPQGRIAAYGLRGESLRTKVVELVGGT